MISKLKKASPANLNGNWSGSEIAQKIESGGVRSKKGRKRKNKEQQWQRYLGIWRRSVCQIFHRSFRAEKL